MSSTRRFCISYTLAAFLVLIGLFPFIGVCTLESGYVPDTVLTFFFISIPASMLLYCGLPINRGFGYWVATVSIVITIPVVTFIAYFFFCLLIHGPGMTDGFGGG